MKFRADKRGATRPSRRKAMAVGVAALAAAAFVAPPAVAEPAAAAPAAAAAALCTTGTVRANVGANLYTGWNSFGVNGYVSAGHNYSCNGHHTGRSYTACGGGNAWILVHGSNLDSTGQVWGWAAAACFSNQ